MEKLTNLSQLKFKKKTHLKQLQISLIFVVLCLYYPEAALKMLQKFYTEKLFTLKLLLNRAFEYTVKSPKLGFLKAITVMYYSIIAQRNQPFFIIFTSVQSVHWGRRGQNQCK